MQERRASGDETRHITQLMVGTLSAGAQTAQVIGIRKQHVYTEKQVRANIRMDGSTRTNTPDALFIS